MEWLISKIDKEFNNNFSFLKLLEVNYDKANKQCLIVFLYPEDQSLEESDKEILSEFIKKQLNLFANVGLKFKKSYLDDKLITKFFFEILKTEFPSIYALSVDEKIEIKKDFNSINLFFDIDKTSLNFINEDEFKAKLISLLENKFCSDFSITLNKISSKILEKAEFLSSPAQKVFSQKTPRYEVEIGRKVFGADITPKPEFIKYIKEEKTSVILAGKIENFEKKSYESKKTKTKGQLKYYYAFELNDSIAKIDVKYFTTTANEKKMDKLQSGDCVLILGDVKSFNKKLSLYIKDISTCKLPEKLEIEPVFNDKYECVSPERYYVLSQDNLFKKKPIYSDSIYNNVYVVFDVETTGLNYETDELLEIGAVKIQNGNIISKFASLIKPKYPIPTDATLINNITDLMVANSPDVDVVIRDFYRFAKDAKMVGYNVAFDQRFIQQAAKKQGLSFSNEFIDVLPLARAKLSLTRYKLTDVVKRLEINLEGAHRALADSLATAETFLQLNSDNYA